MKPEDIATIKECFVDDIIVCASGKEYEVALLPCLICPIQVYWETHNWNGKKETFHCGEVMKNKKQIDDFKLWMAEQW